MHGGPDRHVSLIPYPHVSHHRLRIQADSLFVDGMRMVRARYPNGDPLLPQSGYSSGAKTIAQFPNTAVVRGIFDRILGHPHLIIYFSALCHPNTRRVTCATNCPPLSSGVPPPPPSLDPLLCVSVGR